MAGSSRIAPNPAVCASISLIFNLHLHPLHLQSAINEGVAPWVYVPTDKFGPTFWPHARRSQVIASSELGCGEYAACTKYVPKKAPRRQDPLAMAESVDDRHYKPCSYYR
jgi:hypothetical protein